MSHVLSTIVLATSSNLDNLGVGLAYGIRPRRIRLHHNLLIALVSGSGTLAAMAAGEWINDYMSEEVANVLGAAIMVLIGLYAIAHALRRGRGDLGGIASVPVPTGPASQTSAREGLALAVSLTFNNLGGGLGAGISHLSIPLTTLLTMAASVAAIAGGYHMGRRASFQISRLRLGVTSGLLLVGVGVLEFFV